MKAIHEITKPNNFGKVLYYLFAWGRKQWRVSVKKYKVLHARVWITRRGKERFKRKHSAKLCVTTRIREMIICWIWRLISASYITRITFADAFCSINSWPLTGRSNVIKGGNCPGNWEHSDETCRGKFHFSKREVLRPRSNVNQSIEIYFQMNKPRNRPLVFEATSAARFFFLFILPIQLWLKFQFRLNFQIFLVF